MNAQSPGSLPNQIFIMNIMKFKFTTVLLIVSATTFFTSCNKKESTSEQGLVTLNVAVGGEEYNDEGDIAIKGSTTKTTAVADVQRQEFPFDKDFKIVAEFSRDKSTTAPSAASQSNTGGNKAAVVTTPINRAIKFRLAVYNQAGNFQEDKVYSISAAGTVTPDDGVALSVFSGQYTFLAFSLNTNTAPTMTLAGTSLATAMSINPNTDFMFYNSGLITVGSSSTSNLNIILKHLLTSVTVTVDASPTNGYLVSAIGATTLGTSGSTASLNLATRTVTPGGTFSNKTVAFPTLNTAVVNSTAFLMNNNTLTGAFSMGSLTVGPLSQSTAITFNNIRIQPGVKYNLVLKITPNTVLDQTITFLGVPAVRINGKVWMRHNLGASTSNTPDFPVGGNFQALFGNYYQWGFNTVAATSTTGATAPAGTWSSTGQASATAWNSGTEAAPVKTTADPCPTGWRVPTTTEWNDLIANTTQLQAHNMGVDWTASNTNYTSAKVFRSKHDYNVILTFPAAGDYTPQNDSRALENRGSLGFYWTSQSSSNTLAYRARFEQADGAATGVGINNKPFAFSIRCIAQ